MITEYLFRTLDAGVWLHYEAFCWKVHLRVVK